MDSIREAANINIKYQRELDEIICYGIGNFDCSSGSSLQSAKYNAPLIQLACVLLLRKSFAMQRHRLDSRDEDGDGNDNDNDGGGDNNDDADNCEDSSSDNISSSYERQQSLVSMVYFEPFIQPIERQVLAHFHVQVLDKNEQGKRCIARGGGSNGENEAKDKDKDKDTEEVSPEAPSTLFYMPHCPMRLYSNVLWANWKEELILNGRTVLFGNSFKAYDERIISTEQKRDKTNAIFRLLPFASETQVLSSQGNGNGKDSRIKYRNGSDGGIGISWQELEMAFNDCVVVSFSADADATAEGSLLFPGQPDEYVVESSEDSELV